MLPVQESLSSYLTTLVLQVSSISAASSITTARQVQISPSLPEPRITCSLLNSKYYIHDFFKLKTFHLICYNFFIIKLNYITGMILSYILTVNNCSLLAGGKQSGVGCITFACSITPRAVVLGPTSVHEHGPDGEYDAPSSSRQLQSPWLPFCLSEDGQQPYWYEFLHLYAATFFVVQ